MNLFNLPLPRNEKLRVSFIDGLATELADAFCMNMKPTSTEAQYIMLRNILIAGLHMQGATFNDLIAILLPDATATINKAISQITSPILKQYFQTDFQSASTKRTKEALRLRLTNLVIPQSLFASLCAKECSVNFDSILADNMFVIVKASAPLLGAYQAQTIGNIIVNLLNKYAFERLTSGKETKQFFVYLDEAQYYINSAIQRTLTGVRKTGLCYTLAHQEFCQEAMTPAQQKTIINNTLVKMYGNLQWKDRKEASAILGLDSQTAIENLQAGQFIVKAGRHRATMKHFPSKFAVPNHAFGKGYIFNAYMTYQECSCLKTYIGQRHTEPESLQLFQTDIVTSPVKANRELQQLSFNSFCNNGSKRL
jgi:mannitol/fructose-specific phosphotransferase system IIA component (Ntr-type)